MVNFDKGIWVMEMLFIDNYASYINDYPDLDSAFNSEEQSNSCAKIMVSQYNSVKKLYFVLDQTAEDRQYYYQRKAITFAELRKIAHNL